MRESTIKAIETRYKGYRFRSRLEARWAVFFDAMEITYLYEPEGYRLPDGQFYLPDFWLPQVDLFAEAKASVFTEIEERRCQQLPHECLMLDGPPEPRAYFLAGSRRDLHMSGDMYHLTEHRFFGCSGADYDNPDSWYSEWNGGDRPLAAIETARSARFEHGEHGALVVDLPDAGLMARWREIVALRKTGHARDANRMDREFRISLHDAIRTGPHERVESIRVFLHFLRGRS